MIAEFMPCRLQGEAAAPPSKSMAHRYLIGAALSKETCILTGMAANEDILATVDCLNALGASIILNGDKAEVTPCGFMNSEGTVLNCRESGSTLRFLIPLALCLNRPVTFTGSERLFERPLSVYEALCEENGFTFKKSENSVTLCGKLRGGSFSLCGNISSQFISGLIFALVYLGEDSEIRIIPPFESRPYIDLTLSALNSFGADVSFTDEYTVSVKKSRLHAFSGEIEGDYSNAAFLDVFNFTGSSVTVKNLNTKSLQGDRIYKQYFNELNNGSPTLDISDCPDLGPVLISLAALKNGCTLTGTARLKAKECDRGEAMAEELKKLGGRLSVNENSITVLRNELKYSGTPLYGHNDHRIVMALSLILSKTGGVINGAEAVKKSYPDFFDTIRKLGAKVRLL